MPRLLLFTATTGYQTRSFLDAAARLGVEVVLATDRCHVMDDPWGDQAIPVKFELPEQSAAVVVDAVRQRGPVAGVVALADRPTEVAAIVAAALGLRYHPRAAVQASGDKFIARERFRNANLPVPDYQRVPLDADPVRLAAETTYPCVLKPLGLSASRGVIRADTPAEFAAAFRRIRALLESPDIRRRHDERDRSLQIEAYIDGEEFALEGVVTGGELHVLALFDKPDPLRGPFFEETLYVTPSRQPAAVQARLIDAVRRGVAALGLTHGPIHAEMRWTGQEVYLLEIAARPIGGLCARALTFGQDEPLESLLIRHVLGENVTEARPARPASGVLMLPIPHGGLYQGAHGVEEARRVPGIRDVVITAAPGQRLLPLPEGASYLGFVFAAGESPAAVEAALRESHRRLSFTIFTELPVV